MAQGPGKYDDECTAARLMTNAQAVMLLVLNGDRGTGFSVQASGGPLMPLVLADLLEYVARGIRAGAPTSAPKTAMDEARDIAKVPDVERALVAFQKDNCERDWLICTILTAGRRTP